MTDAEKLDLLLKPIKVRFRAELERILPSFIDFKQELAENGAIAPSTYDAVKAKCHKIVGSSKTLGFNELGVSAAKVEKSIGSIITSEDTHTTTSELEKTFDVFLSYVRAAV